jgi:hypothetical protein
MKDNIYTCETMDDFREFLYTNKGGKTQVRRGTWKNFENHRIYAKWLSVQLKYTKMEDWYKITQQKIYGFHGCGLLVLYYNGSPIKFVMDMYPEHNWKP